MLNFLIQIGLAGAVSSVLLAKFNLRFKNLLNYGKTFSNNSDWGSSNSTTNQPVVVVVQGMPLLNKILSIYVPKRWFSHFYYLSTLLAVFNVFLLQCFWGQGSSVMTIAIDDFVEKYVKISDSSKVASFNVIFEIMRHLFSYSLDSPNSNVLSLDCCYVLVGMILFHSVRRSFECLTVSKFNKTSKINISHYFVGLFFYSALNITVTNSIVINKFIQLTGNYTNDTGNAAAMVHPDIFTLCRKSWWLISLFILAQLDQFRHHLILSQTKKYNHPLGGLFRMISSPHYFDEILIYFIMNVFITVFGTASNSSSGISSTTDNSKWIVLLWNRSFVLIELWIIINLSISAINTHNYYKAQKREDSKTFVAPYAIIPFIV